MSPGDRTRNRRVTHVSVEPPQFNRPEVEIRASSRRTKTGTAHWSGSRIVVQIPASVHGRERRELIDDLVIRLLAQRPQVAAVDADLFARACELADLYLDGVRPSSVRWVTNQRARWASCSPATTEIRVSTRLRQVPDWVIDAVLVHELAHLIHVEHSKEFYALANRHPRQADSAIYLEGLALGLGLKVEESDVED